MRAPMELVANVWPVVDKSTGLVQRFFMRAYAMESDDNVISTVLQALAPTDFRIARVFKIPERFKITSEHGTMSGAVPIGAFQQNIQAIIEGAYRELECDYAKVQGIDMSSGTPKPVNVVPRFPEDPYTIITSLIETFDGQLLPQMTGSQHDT